jgi:LacI family transcriptional regulator
MANVSMKDVAALAGVSVGTVSNTLNSPDRVSEKSRTAVQAAIDKLGWVRNESARQLRAGASHLIGMVVLDISNPFFTDVVTGAEDAMAETGYSVHVANSGQWPEREAIHLERFEQARVAGVLFAPVGELLDRVLRLRSLGIPVVLVDRAADATEACSVAVDDIAGGRLAAEHLLGMGHRRIAFVGGPRELSQVESRRRGAEYAVGQNPQAVLIEIPTKVLDLGSGSAAARKIIDMEPSLRPTAVFAANDLLAIGLLQGLVLEGLRVPEDIAIVGYDDIAFAAAAAVPLSSVRQPRAEIGAQAARLLLAEIAAQGGRHVHSAVRFTPELVIRASSSVRRDPESAAVLQSAGAVSTRAPEYPSTKEGS